MKIEHKYVQSIPQTPSDSGDTRLIGHRGRRMEQLLRSVLRGSAQIAVSAHSQ